MADIYIAKTQQQIYEAMKNYLIGTSSELNNFNEGSRLSALLEAISIVISEAEGDFYQGLKNAIPVAIYNGFNFPRLAGAQSAGTLTFNRTSPAGQTYTIPIGTGVIINGIQFQTTAVGFILNGQSTSGQIASQCTTIGVNGNVGIGTIDTLVGQGSFINQPEGVESCLNAIAFSGGTDQESDADRIIRFKAYINSLSRSNAQGLVTAALTVDGVRSASIAELVPTAGWCTIYIDDGTGTASPTLIAEVQKVIDGDPNDSLNYPGYRGAGIQVNVTAPSVLDIPIILTAVIPIGDPAIDNDLKTLIATAVENYVNIRKIGETMYITEIITAVHNSYVNILDVVSLTPSSNQTATSSQVIRTTSVTVNISRI